MKRGDIVTVSTKGLAANPRPGVIVQASHLIRDDHPVLVCPLTRHLVEGSLICPTIQPTPADGLRSPSQVMVDRLSVTMPNTIGEIIGDLDDADMRSVDLAPLTIMSLGQVLMKTPKTGDTP
ncbi:type II toxin-antitoxin system PemK/MazF family toxin [Fulvimarina sp. MAC3]|uniref:type II toxin-antitoxin system PemK/MazF family toxin n=1 Tax=Fulvimarina sp. MAC3 TaxID=3148887 RepID=UPI0031FD2A61